MAPPNKLNEGIMSQCQDVHLAQHGLVHLATEMATVISPLQTGILSTLNTYYKTVSQTLP